MRKVKSTAGRGENKENRGRGGGEPTMAQNPQKELGGLLPRQRRRLEPPPRQESWPHPAD